MQVKNKLFCHWDLVRFITEKQLQKYNGEVLTLSVTDGNDRECMIFLEKAESDLGYEVRVYKKDKNDTYVPNEYDQVRKYEENSEYVTFFFDEYADAIIFISMLDYLHPEYKERPVGKIVSRI